MPDLDWNNATWNAQYDWHDRGEEWSGPWGGSEPQWFGSLYPRLHSYLPARRILEIAPGFGRWTRFLVPACEEYVGIDLAEKCIDACRETFRRARHASFFVNDGRSLDAAGEKAFDLVFSFDSLVHAEIDVLEDYVPQILRKLSPSGVAFIHHSNLLAFRDLEETAPRHERAKTVSADKVLQVVEQAGGKVLVQELVNSGGDILLDCITLFARAARYGHLASVRLENRRFLDEAAIIRDFQSPYATPRRRNVPNAPGYIAAGK